MSEAPETPDGDLIKFPPESRLRLAYVKDEKVRAYIKLEKPQEIYRAADGGEFIIVNLTATDLMHLGSLL